MRTLNNKEIEFRNKLREEAEIPVNVYEHMNQAYRMIENRQVVQKPESKDPLRFMRAGGRAVGGMAAAVAVGFLVCAANPAMAANLPLVGDIFEKFQSEGTIFGDLAKKATVLDETGPGDNAAASDTASENTGNASSGTDAENSDSSSGNVQNTDSSSANVQTASSAYTKTDAGLTMTVSEVYADDSNIYFTMQIKSDEAFPDTAVNQDGNPGISMEAQYSASFSADGGEEKSIGMLNILSGSFTDANTYECAASLPLDSLQTDISVWQEKYNEMQQQVLDEMGVTMDDLDDSTEEGYALLEQFIDTVSQRAGALEKYKQSASVPNSFSVYLDITEICGDKANPETWDSGYTQEELEAMSDEEFNQVMSKMPEDYSQHPNVHENWWQDGTWSFEIPVTLDHTVQTIEVNDVNDAGLGVKSVEKTEYTLTVNPVYEEGSNSDVILITMDANGNLFWNLTDSQGLEGMDTSTVDIYFIDYYKWMDELKGNYLEKCSSDEEAQTRRDTLEQNAAYHTTVHFEE